MFKKLISCAKCFAFVEVKHTSTLDGLRVCQKCKVEDTKKLEKAFNFYSKGGGKRQWR